MGMSQATLSPKKSVYRGRPVQGMGTSYQNVALFCPGLGGVPNYRAPSLIKTKAGKIICVAGMMNDITKDYSSYGYALRVSSDNGASWGDVSQIYTESGAGTGTKASNGGTLVAYDDGTTYGKLFCFHQITNCSSYNFSSFGSQNYFTSTDGGTTWGTSTDITSQLTNRISRKYTGSITSISVSGVVTCASAHGLTSGKSYKIRIAGASGGNGDYTATYTAPTTFTLTGYSAGSQTGGTWGAVVTNWFNPSGSGIVLTSGRIVVPIYYRYETDASGQAWPTTIRSDDGGTTWTVGGIIDETNAANDGNPIEPTIWATGSNSFVLDCRMKVGSVRKYATSSDGGDTLGNLTSSGINNPSAITGSKSGLTGVNYLKGIWAGPADVLNRAVAMAKATADSGVSYSTGRVLFPSATAYTSIVHVGNEKFIVAYEGTDGSVGISNNNNWAEIRVAVVSYTDAKNSDGSCQIDYLFDDFANGVTYPALGGHQCYNRASPATLMQAGVNGTVTGDSSKGVLGAVIASGGTSYITVLEDSRMPIRSESFAEELTFATTENGSKVLIGGASTGSNQIKITANAGTLTFTIVDNAAATKTATVTGTYADGSLHTVRAEYDAAGTMRIGLDGVYGSTTASGVLSFSNTAERRIGRYNDTTTGAITGSAALYVTRYRLTRGVIPTDAVYGSTPTRRAGWTAGSRPTHFPVGVAEANIKFLLHPYDFSNAAFADDKLSRPVMAVTGYPARSMFSQDANAMRLQQVATDVSGFSTRYARYASDATVGRYLQLLTSNNTCGFKLLNRAGTDTNNFNWMLSTKTGTMWAVIAPTDTGGSQVLWDTYGLASAQADGFVWYLKRLGATTLSQEFVLKCGGTVEYNSFAAPPSKTIAVNAWYFIAVVAKGSGQKPEFWTAPLSASAVTAASHRETPGSNMTATGTPGTASLTPCIWESGNAGGTSGLNGKIAGQGLNSVTMDETALNEVFQWFKTYLGQ